MLYCLKDAKVHEIYRRASDILKDKGLTSVLTYDPYTASVDMYGAILLACGASEKLLASGVEDLDDLQVPPINHVRVKVAYEYVEAVLGQDPSIWAETHTTEQACRAFLRLADRIEISFKIPETISEQLRQKD